MSRDSRSIDSIVKDIALLTQIERDELMTVLLKLNSGKTEKEAKITQLAGMGKEMWKSVDVDKYIRELRDEWDDRKI